MCVCVSQLFLLLLLLFFFNFFCFHFLLFSFSLFSSLLAFRDAWKSIEGRPREHAMREYIDLLTNMAPDWQEWNGFEVERELEKTKVTKTRQKITHTASA